MIVNMGRSEMDEGGENGESGLIRIEKHHTLIELIMSNNHTRY